MTFWISFRSYCLFVFFFKYILEITWNCFNRLETEEIADFQLWITMIVKFAMCEMTAFVTNTQQLTATQRIVKTYYNYLNYVIQISHDIIKVPCNIHAAKYCKYSFLQVFINGSQYTESRISKIRNNVCRIGKMCIS